MRFLVLLVLGSALLRWLPLPAQGFVFYLYGDKLLKWNVNSSQLRPTSVNPVTKAIRYYIAADTFSTANRTNEINAVRASFDQWQSIPGTKVRFEFAGFISSEGLDTRYDNTNVVFWAKKSLRVNAGTEDLTGRRGWTSVTYALDGSILDADIVLNGIQYQWFTDPNDTVNQAQFIEAIVLHEIGHFLGLDHSTAGGATVIDAGNGLNTNRGLSADEVAAARYLYSDGATNRATLQGTVRMNGVGILGASVIAEDSAGNIAGATVTQASGKFAIYALPAGTFNLRVTPLDPANSNNNNSLLRGGEVAVDYAGAVTAFLATTNLALTLQAGQVRTQDVNVTAGNAPFRITSISKPVAQSDLTTIFRYAVSLTQGQSNYFVGVNSSNFQQGATLSVTGDGLTVGATTFYANRVAPGQNTLVVPISVSRNATPGLRTLVVSHNGTLAYANGYLEIASAVPDYNFDGLDDRFQQKYWTLWTAPEAAPSADPDNDGFSNGFEFRTNTDPTNSLSNRLVLQAPLTAGPSDPQISWASDPGKKYQVQGTSSFAPLNWQPVGQPVTAQGETSSVPVAFPGLGQFYRLELKR